MNNLHLTQRQQSLAAGGILLLVVLLLYAVLVLPALSKRGELRGQIDELRFQYHKLHTVVAQRDRIMADLERLRQEPSGNAGFLEEKPEALAAADLQNQIKNIVEGHSGNLISTQVMPQESKGSFPEVRVSIHLRASIENLREIFYALESGQTLLLIDNLYMQKRNSAMVRRTLPGNAADAEADLIEARFEVTGYIYQAAVKS